MPDATELLRALVQAPSPNPPGDERAAMSVLRDYVDDIAGVVVEDTGVAPERPMLIATLQGRGPGRRLLLSGHVDTVPVADGWTRDPFGGEVDGNRLYGLGSSDMKGGIAGFLVALRRLAAQRDHWSGTIVCHLVPDEEPGGQLGAQLLLDRGLIQGDAAIVAEPSELCVYRAQKGNLFVEARFNGRSAHGSTPWLGENAISSALRLGLRLEQELAPRLAARTHELVGPATLSLGTVHGGRRTNMVPDECVLTFDRRIVPGERPEDAIAEIEALVDGKATLTYEHLGAAFETPADHWLVRAAIDVVDEVRGGHFPVGGLVGSSDARFYAVGAEVPTIIVGPGSMNQAHTPDESIDVALLERSVEVYEQLALRVLSS